CEETCMQQGINNAVIRGRTAPGFISKADRLFRNDDAGMFVELLQNARRAGSTSIRVTIEECKGTTESCDVTVQDDGAGIQEFQNLVMLGESAWSAETQQL